MEFSKELYIENTYIKEEEEIYERRMPQNGLSKSSISGFMNNDVESIFVTLQETMDFCDRECRILVSNMVGEAVTRGALRALLEEALEKLAMKDTEMRKEREIAVKKDATITELRKALHTKELELSANKDNSELCRQKQALEFARDLEQTFRHWKQCEGLVSEKEGELIKMSRYAVEISSLYNEETKKTAILEKQLKSLQDSGSMNAKEQGIEIKELKEILVEKEKEIDELKISLKKKDKLLDSLQKQMEIYSETINSRDRDILDLKEEAETYKLRRQVESESIRAYIEANTAATLKEIDCKEKLRKSSLNDEAFLLTRYDEELAWRNEMESHLFHDYLEGWRSEVEKEMATKDKNIFHLGIEINKLREANEVRQKHNEQTGNLLIKNGQEDLLISSLRREVVDLEREKKYIVEEIYKLKRALWQDDEEVVESGFFLSNDREIFNLSRWSADWIDRVGPIDSDILASVFMKECENEKASYLEKMRQIEKDARVLEKKLASMEETGAKNLGLLEKDVNMLEKKLAAMKELESEKAGLLQRMSKYSMTEANLLNCIEGLQIQRHWLNGEQSSRLRKVLTGELNLHLHAFERFEDDVKALIQDKIVRLEHLSNQYTNMKGRLEAFEARENLYKKHLLQEFSNLQKAEAEVDLLGDEVDALLELLEKVVQILDVYTPMLKNCPEITELVKLLREELQVRTEPSLGQ